jgi:hypothetical protein
LFMKNKCHYGSKCVYSHSDKPTEAASAPNTPARQSNNSPAPGTD